MDLFGVLFNFSVFFFSLLVEPNLDKVLKTQYVLSNHSSSLWCPAQGAPAPFIVWRKNGIAVQNSTSVMFQLKITEKNNAKYSCEVNRKDGVDKKEFRLVIEREYFNILTFIHAYTDAFKISTSNHIY